MAGRIDYVDISNKGKYWLRLLVAWTGHQPNLLWIMKIRTEQLKS